MAGPGRFPSDFRVAIQESPRQTKPKEGAKRKAHEFRPYFCEFWCFSLGKQARFTLNSCSGMPLRKVHELAFLWCGLPGRLLILPSETCANSEQIPSYKFQANSEQASQTLP